MGRSVGSVRLMVVGAVRGVTGRGARERGRGMMMGLVLRGARGWVVGGEGAGWERGRGWGRVMRGVHRVVRV